MNNKKLKEIGKRLLSKKGFKIVFLGDSIVSAESIHPNWREIFEYVLKGKVSEMMNDWKTPDWGIKCINSGLNGATSQNLLTHLNSEVFFYKPNMVICMIGKNDPYFKINPSAHKKNIETLTKKITEKIPFFVFCTPTPDNNKKTNKIYEQYAEEDRFLLPQPKTQFIDLFKIYQGFDLDKIFTFISQGNEDVGIKPGEPDFQHPNALGHAYIAKVILKEVFGIDFNPELYMKTLLAGEKYPKY